MIVSKFYPKTSTCFETVTRLFACNFDLKISTYIKVGIAEVIQKAPKLILKLLIVGA